MPHHGKILALPPGFFERLSVNTARSEQVDIESKRGRSYNEALDVASRTVHFTQPKTGVPTLMPSTHVSTYSRKVFPIVFTA